MCVRVSESDRERERVCVCVNVSRQAGAGDVDPADGWDSGNRSSANLSFVIASVKNKSTDLCGNSHSKTTSQQLYVR